MPQTETQQPSILFSQARILTTFAASFALVFLVAHFLLPSVELIMAMPVGILIAVVVLYARVKQGKSK